MGYASPNWGSVADSSGKTTTKKQTTTKATTKKATTTKKHSSSKTTTKKSSTTKKSKNETTTKSTTTKVETTTKAETVEAKKMELYAPTQELEIGDSVQLDYTIKPSGANAVVGYFCDEEDIIEISDGGLITATGEGTATVVVCANDTIYKQCDFTVTAQNSDITKHYNDSERKIVGQLSSESTEMTNKTPEQRLTELGVNLSMLTENPKLYFVPLAILGVALVLSACIYLIKRFKRK
jgi:cobalamin biosynthesis Mg chelatase CobN